MYAPLKFIAQAVVASSGFKQRFGVIVYTADTTMIDAFIFQRGRTIEETMEDAGYTVVNDVACEYPPSQSVVRIIPLALNITWSDFDDLSNAFGRVV